MCSTRLPASRTTAKASAISSSSDSPCARRALNSAVLPRSCSSERRWTSGSNAFTRSTSGRSRLISRSFCVPKTLARSWPTISGNETVGVSDDYIVKGIGGPCRRVRTNETRASEAAQERALPSPVQHQLERVQEPSVSADFVVQVRSGRAAGRSHQSDDIAALHLCAHVDAIGRKVAVARLESVAVI